MKQATRETAEKIIELLGHGLTSGKGSPKPGQMCVEAAVCYAMGLPHSDEPVCVSPAIRAFKIKLNDSAWSSNRARAEGMKRLAIAQLNSAGAVDDLEFVKRIVDLLIRKSVPFALRAIATVKGHAAFKDRLEAAANRCETEGTRQSALGARDLAREACAAAYAAAHAAAYADAAADAAAYAAAAADAAAAAHAAAHAAAAAAAHAGAHAAAAAHAAANAVTYAATYAANYADAAAATYTTTYANAARDKYVAFTAEEVVQILIDMKAPGCEWLDLAPIQNAA